MSDWLDGAVWSTPAAVAVFAAAAFITVVGSIGLAALGDVLADRLGVGEALFGAVIFGRVTSLSGIVMTLLQKHHHRPVHGEELVVQLR